ncbi:MAG: NAD(P)-dependent oxidoreductase [bacterium]
MKTLVTGAPGWLGTRLVEALTGKAPELTQYSAHGSRQVRVLAIPNINVTELNAMGAEVLRGDVRDEQSLNAACQGVDTIFHCVGLIHPKNIKDLYEVNTRGTLNLIRSAQRAGVKRIIYVSSNSPAGCNVRRDVLLKETDANNPYKTYGKSKAKAEEFIRLAFQDGRMETVIVRPCWFYGPNQPARQSRFFNMIKSGKPIIFGDGKNLRSMSYIDNSVQGILLSESASHANGHIYWLADARPYSTLEIYQTIAELLNVELKPRFIPGLASEICELADDFLQTIGIYSTDFHVAGEMNKDIACSIEKAQRHLGYKPTIDLREGMRRSIEWCRNNGLQI